MGSHSRAGLRRSAASDARIDSCFQAFRRRAKEFATGIAEFAGLEASRDPARTAELNREIMRALLAKWSTEILATLYSMRSLGFERLRRALRGISPRVLSAKLKALESQGPVSREVLHERPPRVQYSLTEAGLTVANPNFPRS
jgi:DNA-binding HxlR family transcriptional regulator